MPAVPQHECETEGAAEGEKMKQHLVTQGKQ